MHKKAYAMEPVIWIAIIIVIAVILLFMLSRDSNLMNTAMEKIANLMSFS